MPSALLRVQAGMGAVHRGRAGCRCTRTQAPDGERGLSRETNAAQDAGLVSLLNLFPHAKGRCKFDKIPVERPDGRLPSVMECGFIPISCGAPGCWPE